MVGPGTGVAPFRGFIQERARQAQNGATVGRTILFFGCRKRSEDFLYESEWGEYKKALGDSLESLPAFSRESSRRSMSNTV
ncbi:hypothetical protein J3459_010239 [Metarhizium acridum]|nr:hypothetical protein J3459_010239 [Metarhizium acridum]